MANVGFGITQLDILGTGTPIIESTTGNLELKSNEIKVGTGVTISSGIITAINAIKVGTGITISSGIVTATSFVGNGANLTALNASNIESGTVPTARLGTGTANSSTFLAGDSTYKTVTGTTINNNADNRVITGSNSANTLEAESSLTYDGTTLTATSFSGSGNDIVTSRWDVVGGGTYAFTGPGGLSSASQPKIYLARGQTYEFVISNASSHPFQIQQSNGTVYNTGVTNNGSSVNGVVVKFEVPFSAPNSLQYVCTVHSGMGNTIIIYPDLSP